MRLESFRAALGLLTRLPAGSAERHAGGSQDVSGERPQWEQGPQFGDPQATSAEQLRSGDSQGVSPRVVAWFPLVGAIVGGVGVLTWVIVEGVVGRTPAAVAAVLATIVVTGALHEDGLADTADGLWGGATRERRLEIMRDSSIGTYGALALAGDLLLRTVMLAQLGMPDIARALIAAHVIGRLAPLAIAAWLPPARQDGLGAGVSGGLGRRTWLIAGVTVSVAVIGAAGFWAPLLLAAAAIPVWLVRRTASRRIGGFTGDVLGAAVATSSLAVTATVTALVQAGAF